MMIMPNLADQKVSRCTLMIGFSFSLAPDGAPGTYNEKIAQGIREELKKANHQNGPWVGVQWEIYDAIEELDQESNDNFKAIDFIPETHVVAPPLFQAEDFKNVEAIINLIRRGATHVLRTLRGKLEELLEQVGYASFDDALPLLDARKLALFLNRLLEERKFFEDFVGDVELHDLHRSGLGSLGVEKRVMPNPNSYQEGLRRFQARRVNRLIIEAIIPDPEILKRGQYLSTQGVIDQLLSQVEREEREIQYVLVYGHPEHSPRCRRQLIETAWERGWKLEVNDVIDVYNEQQRRWKWDPETAQMWCRSKKNWDDYEKMGKERLR